MAGVVGMRDGVLEKIERQTMPTACGCLIWLGYISGSRYPRIAVDGKRMAVHRFLYEQAYGPLPVGMLACHTCDIPACCNIDHVYAGTAKQNAQDRQNRGRDWSQTKPHLSLAWSRLTAEQVSAIKASSGAQRQIAAEFKVSQAMVSMIKSNKRRKGR